MNKIGFLGLSLIGALAASGLSAQPLMLVTGSDYAPFSDEKLPEGGLATEIVKKAMKLAGVEVQINFFPWKRGYDGTLDGEFAATFPYVPTDERKAAMEYSDPIVTIRQVVFSAKDKPVLFSAVADLKGKTICQPIGYALPADLEPLVANGEIKREAPKELDNCGRMLLIGRADFLVGDAFTLGAMFQRIGGVEKIGIGDRVLDTTYLHLIASKKAGDTASVITAFNAGLKQLKDSGEYTRIMTKATGGM